MGVLEHRIAGIFAALLGLGIATTARAEDDALGATAVVRAPMAATHAEDASASGSTLEVGPRVRALEEVGEAVADLPGVRVSTTGGVGAPSLVALRGAEVGHTDVLLGAIPLNTADTGAFDLSLLPLSAFDRIEVYRGGAPAWFASGAIGGVIRFVPVESEASALQASAGIGSFGRRELRATTSLSRPGPLRPGWFGHVRLLEADNDYAYVDDGKTRFDTRVAPADADDGVRHQRNAQLLAGDALMHGSIDAAGGRLSLVFAGHGRTEGVPGSLAAPAYHARRKLVRTLLGVSYTREVRDADGERSQRMELVASGSHQVNAVTDLDGAIGLSDRVASDDVWQHGFLRGAFGLRVLPFLEPSVIVSTAVDAYRPRDPAAFTNPPRPSDRTSAAIGFEPRIFGSPWGMRAELRPSVRAEWSRTAIHVRRSPSSTDETRDEVVPTYRLAAAIEPLPALSLSSSVSTGKRLPSMLELFGDRVYLEANPDLTPERSTAVDVGAVARGRVGELRGSLEARGFQLWIDDLIRYERTSQETLRPRNEASAEVRGLELGLLAHYGRHLSLASTLTALDTENVFGKQLPLRPPLQVLARPTLRLFPALADAVVSLYGEVHHVAFIYLDDANRSNLPGRTVLSAGCTLELFHGALGVAASVGNILHEGPEDWVSDVLGRPLPGRDVRVALTLRETLPP